MSLEEAFRGKHSFAGGLDLMLLFFWGFLVQMTKIRHLSYDLHIIICYPNQTKAAKIVIVKMEIAFPTEHAILVKLITMITSI